MGQKVVFIDTYVITDWFRQGAEHRERVIQGLPGDAKLIRIIPDHSINYAVHSTPRLALVYESSEWPESPEGSILPEQRVLFETIRNDR